jgi:soluble lytic murein transglycosylase
MVERSGGNLVFATASYNAGPGNVDKWRRANPTRDMQDFIDAIPFTETRGFVKKVLGNYAAYRSIYGGER